MAVGWPTKTTYANGDVYSASDVNDTNGTLNLAAGAPWAAGKNIIINGDLRINQRNFTSNTANLSFNFDRFSQLRGGGGTLTTTPQTFTPGAAPVAGYGGTNFLQAVTASQSAASDYAIIKYADEDVRNMAGKTFTISFWAKATSGTPSVAVELEQGFGSGGSTAVEFAVGKVTLSTSWARYSVTANVPSVSGKTIGAGSGTNIYFWVSAGSTFNTRASSIGNQNNTFQFWGFQAEQGSVATAFQTATGTIQGELAACQRYYYRSSSTGTYGVINGYGYAVSTSNAQYSVYLPVQMRVMPTAVDYSTVTLQDNLDNVIASITAVTLSSVTSSTLCGTMTINSSSLFTTGRTYRMLQNGSASGYIGFSAEL